MIRKWLKKAAAAIVSLALAGCGASAEQKVELFAVSVGKGDALLIRVDDYTCLIDAGKAYVMGRVRAAMKEMGVEALDAVFLTHPDDDHAGGLAWLAASEIPVGQWYASGMFTEVKEKKHPALTAAAARDQEVTWLERGDSVPLGKTGATFRVLAPEMLFTDKDDNNSLVMMLETGEGRMLFTGDMELAQEAVLLEKGDDLSCAVLKVPNHGDDDTLSAEFARAASAQVAIISTDSEEKPGTPDPGVLARLTAAGSACYVTQDADLGFRVTLRDGKASVENVGIGEPLAADVHISQVAPGDDVITLAGTGEARDLSGWYLYSDRGSELFIFPEGTVLEAGGMLSVGTLSSGSEPYDVLWEDKKVVHASKTDAISLFDRWGRLVDSLTNGL